jgi:SAM-dependent methyltransferase
VAAASWFDDVAETYDRIRPLYPERLYADLFNYIGDDPLNPGTLATVEIGPGTGQATGALLERGATVAAIEPGTRLATFLREKFPDEPRLVVINERFEDAPLPECIADMVFAATSFHWVDPEVRYAKALEVLRPGGVLAIVYPHQIASDVDRGYFHASQPIYARYFGQAATPELPDEEVTPDEIGEIIDTQRFESIELFRYRFDQRYSTAEYIDLVRSYSGTNQLEAAAREAFLEDLAAFIDAEFEGYVIRPLVLTLVLGRKRAAST